jgi:hypothetical protein
VLREGFSWDAEDRLRGVKNNPDLEAQYRYHHYIYDHKGDRLMTLRLGSGTT